ncbi:MAG: isochorismatase family cysteine hydrolase [Caldilineaceae bacterium]
MPTRDPLNHIEEQASVALILIDVINDLEFEGGEALLPYALPMAKRIASLKAQAKQAGIPVIYANDNFGRWRSDREKLVKDMLEQDVRGQPIVKLLRPDPDDYFVLKPRHSAFYLTNLDLLLRYVGAKRLILTGLAGDICVLFTANDAYMREFEVIVPADCVASEDIDHNEQALQLMQRVLKADLTPSTELDLVALSQKLE